MTLRILAAAVAATVALAGTASATSPAIESDTYAAMGMYLINPHGEQTASAEEAKFTAMIEEKRAREVAAWSNNYSRDVYPEYGIGSVHAEPQQR